MNSSQLKFRAFFAVGAAMCALTFAGCGGGGSSGGPPAPTPLPTALPPTNVRVTVQLRDTGGLPVEGLVTIDGQRRATTGGNASFANVRAGALTISAEVNGANYSQNFVATSGDNTVQIAINPAVNNPGDNNPPTPPF